MYHDKQNRFQYVVTSANVQSDARLGANLGSRDGFGELGDKTWDAVWESKVKIQPDGWTVEIRIPFFSLRFAKKPVQNWGVQFARVIRRTNESCYWNPVDPNVNGFVNQFGVLTGLENLKPPLRLSFSPYVSGAYRHVPDLDSGFVQNWTGSGGMDLKYGVSESFTLDATLIPYFGQVISDNLVNNLTHFEIFFQENRPFFTEGMEIFKKANLFNTRRVGAMPSKYNYVRYLAMSNPNWEIIRNPAEIQIYNAMEFSGRTKKKLGLGIFNAVTAPMYAKLRNKLSGKDTLINTEPLANYNVLVVDQALRGRSSLTFTNTNVMRNGSERDANVSAFDFSLFDKKNNYNLKGTARYSKIFVPSSITPTDGYNASLRFAKISGNWRYFIQGNEESARYNPRDLGFLQPPNEISYQGGFSYNNYKTAKFFSAIQTTALWPCISACTIRMLTIAL
ncbi:MAG: DUF5916 domain-containing protein [Chitinophagaceae bacterium]|nr:DUF5916 domain-containing protein [Chitinophagaceae bacterium]